MHCAKLNRSRKLAFTYKTNDIVAYNSISYDGTDISVAKAAGGIVAKHRSELRAGECKYHHQKNKK